MQTQARKKASKAEMTIKLLVVIDSFDFGGAENLLAVLARAAPKADLEMHVASLAPRAADRNSFLPLLAEAGLELSFLDIPRLLHPAAVPRLRRLIKVTGADVVHAHLGYSATLAPPAARLARRPCAATLHHVPEDESRREQIKERLSLSVAGRLGTLVFVSEASRQGFARRYPERPSWRTVHNGIDLTRYSPAAGALPRELGIPANVPVVTIVAALREPKGHEFALRAWPQVLATAPEARLLIVGEGIHREHLEHTVRELDLAERVVLAGARHDIPDLLRGSTLAALPSLTEALPTSLIEAAGCGLAAVATSVGGVPEVVDDGVSGLLVPPGDAPAFGAAVAALLGDARRRESMGARARAMALERFDVDVWAGRLRDLYEEMLARGSLAD